MLIDCGADVNQVLDEGGEKMSLLNALCGVGVNTTEFTENQVYPLVELLLNKGAAIDSLDESRNSSLHLAAASNFTKIVILLIDRGANPRLRNIKGQTPMKTAQEAKHDPNYIYAHLHELELKQKSELAELKVKNALLKSEMSKLQKQNEILKESFAVHRRMVDKEIQDLKVQKGYEPRFSANLSAVNSSSEAYDAQQLEGKSKESSLN